MIVNHYYKTNPKNADSIFDEWTRAGCVFEASALLSIPAGADKLEVINKNNAGYTFATVRSGSKPLVLFSRKISFDGEGVYAYVYRDPIYTGGNLFTDIRNPNDINPKISEATVKTGILPENITSLGAESRAPSFIFGNSSNQGSGGTLQAIDSPQYILPQKELMLIFKTRSTNSVQSVGSSIKWAEVDKLPDFIIQNGQFVSYSGYFQ